jgi:DNA modification methylase
MITIINGDCREMLKTLPDQSVHCCVTSPPYFGLRDYGHDGQIGLEQTPDAFVAKLVDVFREVKRVLRDDGTVWLNLGDSYAGSHGTTTVNDDVWASDRRTFRTGSARFPDGYKPKDLIGIPWRVAFALQADGWYLRQDIIWHKPNPMPESVTDRCTKAHEYIFLLSKSARYYFDSDAIKEKAETPPHGPGYATFDPNSKRNDRTAGNEANDRAWGADGRRNKRSVWTITTKPYSGAHFATFPPDLITPCILAGCPTGGTVLDPFGGSGTTGEVAESHGRNAVLIELNPAYIDLIKERTKQQGLGI